MRNWKWLAAALAFTLLMPAASAELPPSVYTQEGLEIPPQAMDYDEENQLFIAHPGWLDGNLIHYYKFRMYVPPNYGTDDGGLSKVPIAPLYLPSTDGTLAGVPDGQRPVLAAYPVAGDTAYSDFVHVHFVDVPSSYSANTHRSAGDLLAAHGPGVPTGIFANVPVVPNGAHLQDPAKLDVPRDDPAAWAPIDPWAAWYEGDEAWTYIFETTDPEFAAYANANTRTEASGAAGSGYESVVVPGFAFTGGLSAIPIWHVNQYFTGVTPGVNNGGPADIGQRNVIDMDRLDPGYSPLWQVFWATQIPLGYGADDARRASDFQDASGVAHNGFAIAQTPMYVNCPNIGPHGGTPVSDSGADSFGIADVSGMETVVIEGSLVMTPDTLVTFWLHDEDIGGVNTGMMGAYRFEVPVSLLDRGDNTVEVKQGEEVVATYVLSNGEAPQGNDTIVWIVVVAALIVLVYAYGRMKRPQSGGGAQTDKPATSEPEPTTPADDENA